MRFYYLTKKLTHPKLLLSLYFSLILNSSYSQSDSKNGLYGIVRDSSGEPLIGVNLLISNGQIKKGTVTGIDGSYQIESLKIGIYTLEVSYIGFKPEKISIHINPDTFTTKDIQLTSDNLSLEDVQVIGKSTVSRINEQAYEVQAISTKGLENVATNAQTILNNVSGVRIAEEGGVGSNSTFSLNGFSGSQIKFFMDGIPMDNFGSSMSLGDLPVNLIKRIEVYKGVVPVYLGNDALGGAVNIITHNTAKYIDASYTIGSFNTHRTSVNGANTWQNGFTVRSNFFYNYSDNNYEVYVDNEKQWHPRFHNKYKSATAKVEAGIVDKTYADNLLLGIIVTGNNKQQQTGSTMAKVYGGVLSESQSLISTLRYNKKSLFIDALDVSYFGAYTKNESHSIDTLRGVSYNWNGEAIKNTASANGEMGARTFTIFKVDELSSQFNASYASSRHSTVSINYALSNYHRSVSDSLNLDDESNFFPKNMLKQSFGIAYKYDRPSRWSTTVFTKYFNLNAKTSKRFDKFLSTERIGELVINKSSIGYGLASSVFIIPQCQLKLSYEYAFRMPTPLEMFGNGLFINPNSDLKPESSDNVNFSVDYKQTFSKDHRFSVGANVLYRNAKNLIYAKVSPGKPKSAYANSLKIRFIGTEGNVEYGYKERYHLKANITYQNITDRAKKVLNKQASGDYWETNYSYGFRLPNRPYLFGHLNTGINFPNWLADNTLLSFDYHLNFSERYFLTWIEMGTNNDKYIIPRQWSHDLQFSYSIKGGRYNISGSCTNVLNVKLYDKYRLQKPGRAFNIKLRLSI